MARAVLSEPRRRRGRPGRSRDDVVRAARRLVATAGLEAFTLDAVAREAGMTRTALLHHFHSKEALVGSLASALAREEIDALLAAIEPTTTAEGALLALLEGFVALYARDLDAFRAHYVLPQILGMDERSLEAGVYPLANALFDAIEMRIRREQQAGTLDDAFDGRRFAVFVWTVSLGVAFRASLLQRTRSRTSTQLDTLLSQARLAIRSTIAQHRARRTRG